MLAGAPTGKRGVMQSPPATSAVDSISQTAPRAPQDTVLIIILCAGAFKKEKKGIIIVVVFIIGGGVWSGPLCRQGNWGSEGLRNLRRCCAAWDRSHLCSLFSGLPAAGRDSDIWNDSLLAGQTSPAILSGSPSQAWSFLHKGHSFPSLPGSSMARLTLNKLPPDS